MRSGSLVMALEILGRDCAPVRKFKAQGSTALRLWPLSVEKSFEAQGVTTIVCWLLRSRDLPALCEVLRGGGRQHAGDGLGDLRVRPHSGEGL
jgi:hypothetical protein